MTINLTADQMVSLTVAVVDHFGNPVTLDGVTPAWSTDHAELLTVTASAGGYAADAVTVGPVGSAAISVEVTFAGPDGNPVTLSAADDVVITAGAAAALVVTAAGPVAKV